jgi:thiol-disulfide isomerase/thioredoxin
MKTIVLICALLTSIGVKAQPIKKFILKDTGNASRTFTDLKGEKLTLIDFWLSSCKPCNQAIKELNKIYKLYKDKGVEIIGINCDGPRSVSKVAPLSKSLQIKYPVLIDINSEVSSDLNVMSFPTLVFVNTEGIIVWILEGFVANDTESIIAEIEKNLNAE